MAYLNVDKLQCRHIHCLELQPHSLSALFEAQRHDLTFWQHVEIDDQDLVETGQTLVGTDQDLLGTEQDLLETLKTSEIQDADESTRRLTKEIIIQIREGNEGNTNGAQQGEQPTAKERAKCARREARLDPEYRDRERQRNNEARRRARLDPDYRLKERLRNNEARRRARLNPEFRQRERERERLARRLARCNPEYREKEKLRNRIARRQARLNPDYRSRERDREKLRCQLAKLGLQVIRPGNNQRLDWVVEPPSLADDQCNSNSNSSFEEKEIQEPEKEKERPTSDSVVLPELVETILIEI